MDPIKTLHARIRQLEAILAPFANYAIKRDAMPLRGQDDVVHSIHKGSEYEAEITLNDCRAARDALKETEK